MSMKLKSILLAVLFLTFLSACSSLNHEECLKSVQKVFPHAKVYFSLEKKYKFIVVDSSNIWFVETNHLTNSNISSISPLSLAQ